MNYNEIKIAILTPTFNRKKELNNLYDSLKRQTNKNFVWYIIDDGSNDGTGEWVQSISNSGFAIHYEYKQNGGKHTALNIGIAKTKEELTFIVDSDDTLTSDAISTIYKYWNKYHNKDLCGISFLRGYSEQQVIGEKYSENEFIDSLIHSAGNSYGKMGDKAEVWVTDILKQTPFLEFDNEKFFAEGYVWAKIGKKYNMLFVNKIIYITEYLVDGLTRSGRIIRIRSPRGAMANANELVTSEFKAKIRVKNTLLYIAYAYFANYSCKEILQHSNSRVLTGVLWPEGYLVYRYWRYKYIRKKRR